MMASVSGHVEVVNTLIQHEAMVDTQTKVYVPFISSYLKTDLQF